MARGLELTPRLRRLADWVPLGTRLADIGTDHAYLPVWLVLEGRVASAIASDLRPGPLQRAKETAKTYGTEIDCRLCNGLTCITPDEVDTIVIAGMGGETIAAILSAAPWTAMGHHTLLLQPMTRSEALRLFLMEHGYAIKREALVLDRGGIMVLDGRLDLGNLEKGQSLEEPCREVIDRIYELTSRKEPYSASVLNSYLYFKEREIEKIITTIERIRYGVAAGI